MGGFDFSLWIFFEKERGVRERRKKEEDAFLMKECEKERRRNLTIEKSYILVYNIQ